MRKIRNIMRYIVVLILNFFLMLAFHSYLNFVLMVGLIIFPVYSVYGISQIRKSLSLEVTTPFVPMKRGEEFQIMYILHNASWFPLVNATLLLEVGNIFFSEQGSHYLNVPLRARRKTTIQYPVTMEYCGRFRVTAVEIVLVDLFGIYQTTVSVQKSAECLVFPDGETRMGEAGKIYQKGVTEAMESRGKGYDFSEVTGIREYIPGDRLQNIHWKLSVKKDELMVKERDHLSAMQFRILVDLANNEQMRTDAVLELADGITKAFVIQNRPFSVCYYSMNTGELEECFIGNEIERQQWLEQMLYDRCSGQAFDVEELFRQEYQGMYLYIGAANGELEYEAEGTCNTVAVLRQ